MSSIKATKESSIDEKPSRTSSTQVPQHSSTLPDAAAPPDQVRFFISHLLRKRGVPHNDIQPVVANWKLGSGRELRVYDPSMYFNIFGAEYGWMIYREVHLAIHEENRKSIMYAWGDEMFAGTLAVIAISLLYWSFCDISNAKTIVARIGAGLAGFALFISLLLIFTADTFETSIEKALWHASKAGGSKEE